MITRLYQNHLSRCLNESVTRVQSISGGDISSAYRVDTSSRSFFLKSNNASNAIDMFQAETKGLQLIRETNTIKVPKVYGCDTIENTAYLLLEFVENKTPSNEDFKTLALQLAKLHQITQAHFGLDHNNYIGSLPQNNTFHNTWIDFYISERLAPQLELAKQKGLLAFDECPSKDHLKNVLEPYFGGIAPVLIHGDLWSGNFLIHKNGSPYLIDPAVYYGHNVVDIAMSKLFGGFGESFYKTYYSVIGKNAKHDEPIEIYQLYYLLVHLNLFGKSYYHSVKRILKNHF